MSGIAGRFYLDPGDRLSGYRRPPDLVQVITQWSGKGPRNVAVRRQDGTVEVIPFSRRLRKAGGER